MSGVNVTETDIPGLLIIDPVIRGDRRGFFLETWHRARYAEAGLPTEWTQDNLSRSHRGVLRGLHYQWPRPQGKLVGVIDGEAFDVAVDLRRGSPSFGQWMGVTLSGETQRQLWIPPGFAHGFVVTSESALFAYKCVGAYDPTTEMTLRWDDPEIGIEWPEGKKVLSDKDARGLSLAEIPADRLPD